MIVVDGSGIPLGCLLDSASPAEVRLAEATLNDIHVPKGGKGRTRSRPKRPIIGRSHQDMYPKKRRDSMSETWIEEKAEKNQIPGIC